MSLVYYREEISYTTIYVVRESFAKIQFIIAYISIFIESLKELTLFFIRIG